MISYLRLLDENGDQTTLHGPEVSGETTYTNHITNPSAEIDTSTWTLAYDIGVTSTSLSRATDWAEYGDASFAVAGTHANHAGSQFVGMYSPDFTGPTCSAGDAITASCRVHTVTDSATSTYRIRVGFYSSSNSSVGGAIETAGIDATTALGQDGIDISVSGVAPANAAKLVVSVYMYSSTALAAMEFRADGVMVTINEDAPDGYFDGDTEEAVWNGAAGLSTSTLSSSTFTDQTNRKVTGIAGLPGLDSAGAREAITPRPGAHGSINRTLYFQDQVLTIEGYVRGDDRDEAIQQLDIIKAALVDCLDTPRQLRWQRGDTGAELFTLVRYGGAGMKVVPDGAERVLRYQINLELPDPRAYDQNEISQNTETLGSSEGGLLIPFTFPMTFDLGSAGLATAGGGGIVPTPAVFRIYGSVTNPTIKLMATGQVIVLTGEVSDGDYIDVDTAEHEVRSSNGLPINSMVDWAQTEWFDMPAAGGQVRLIADSGDSDAYMTVTYRPAYV